LKGWRRGLGWKERGRGSEEWRYGRGGRNEGWKGKEKEEEGKGGVKGERHGLRRKL
jgi:hypothetical protein